jgi:hypothetical protein
MNKDNCLQIKLQFNLLKVNLKSKSKIYSILNFLYELSVSAASACGYFEYKGADIRDGMISYQVKSLVKEMKSVNLVFLFWWKA